MDKRLFVRKKTGFRVKEAELLHDFKVNLGLSDLESVNLYNVYDVFDIDIETLEKAKTLVFSEKNADILFDDVGISDGELYLGVTPLPEQFDMRASAAMDCIKLINNNSNALVESGELLVLKGIDKSNLEQVKKYYINTLESMEKDFNNLKPKEHQVSSENNPIAVGFIDVTNDELKQLASSLGISLNFDNLIFVRDYFKKEKRNPSLAELMVIDTYWSDHCRHSTFFTTLDNIVIEDCEVGKVFDKYLNIRNKQKPVTLMDMGTTYAKYAKKQGYLKNLENTTENNACSVEVEIDVDGKQEVWLHQFKNETHNHPTEIEPFGGAATCLGGAIRDPLSGRAFVFQGMRVSGSGDINKPIFETLKGKLPQSVISKKSAEGFSSYGNQIGLATTYVEEVVHKNYEAKTLEAGAVIGAVKKVDVLREEPTAGDVILLIGGRTGKDGIGGATGSSKTQDEDSIVNSGGEVQKGNAPEERKLQRLFRNPKFTQLIKKSNDFGAGGVSVAIGELADSVHIYLERVPLKNTALRAFEIAISESQERMAVVVNKQNVQKIIEFSHAENLNATHVADVTTDNKLLMTYENEKVVEIKREFLETNGVLPTQEVLVKQKDYNNVFTRDVGGENFKEKFINNLKQDNIASKKGMVDMFDFSVLGTTVLAPFGGKYQLTKAQSSIQKFPVPSGKTNAVSAMAMGFNPELAMKNPFLSSMYGGIYAVSKLVANGIDYETINFSLQEYFERLHTCKEKWGKVLTSLMGTFYVQEGLKIAAIGGKDSMSGTFENIDVPPTLITFAFGNGKLKTVISNEFKKKGNYIYLIKHTSLKNGIADTTLLKQNFDYLKSINSRLESAYAVGNGGLAEALCKMSFGNKLGVNINYDDLFCFDYGSIVVETAEKLDYENAILLGEVSDEFIVNGEKFAIEDLIDANFNNYEGVFKTNFINEQVDLYNLKQNTTNKAPKYKENVTDVKVFIPIFPGTNSEYDTVRVFENAGATVNAVVFKNQTATDIENSIIEMVEHIKNSHIIAFCGGFSSGDEPDGSGKFIANVINNEQVKNALQQFLADNKLILGTCNGFQALIKSGLVTYGKADSLTQNSPTLATNDIGRHISRFVGTKVMTTRSPWTYGLDPNKRYVQAVSHTEGRFVASGSELDSLINNDQIAFVYTDQFNNQAVNNFDNPNGSTLGIEGIISPCGNILGKMAHCERYDDGNYLNIEKNLNENESLWLDIFKNAVNYFKA